MRINLIGGSGAGATTLGRMLAEELEFSFFDADDFLWLDDKFENQRPRNEIIPMVNDTLSGDSWVLAGGLFDWDVEVDPDLYILLTPARGIRLERLYSREKHSTPEFLEWASKYEAGDIEGKTLQSHRQALAHSRIQHFEYSNNSSLDSSLLDLIREVVGRTSINAD